VEHACASGTSRIGDLPLDGPRRRRHEIDGLARRLLRRRSVRKKLLGLVTLGQLRDRLEWPRLCQIANPGTRCCHSLRPRHRAHRPAAAAGTVVSLIVGHLNWPAAKIASILEDIGPERVSGLSRGPAASSESHRPGSFLSLR